MNELLPPDVITLELLAEFFTAGDLQCEVDEDGDLIVIDPEDEWVTVVSLEAERSFVHFSCYGQFKEDSEQAARLDLVDRLNRETVLARWYTSDDGMMITDYALTYEGGMTPFQILRTYRWFTDVVKAGASALDSEDIVE